jgi:hypothetical protein
MEETYKNILGYEGLYQISNLGNVKSLARAWKTGKNYLNKFNSSEKILKLSYGHSGYRLVTLTKDGKQKTFRVHVLVWDTFSDIKRNNLHVDHIDENKNNNGFANLQLLSCRKNIIKSLKHRGRFVGHAYPEGSGYRAQISDKGKTYYIGNFATKNQAINAYNQKLQEFL